MVNQGSKYLIEQVISSKLSKVELDEFLAGLHSENAVQLYSDVLKKLFEELVNQRGQQPEIGTQVGNNEVNLFKLGAFQSCVPPNKFGGNRW